MIVTAKKKQQTLKSNDATCEYLEPKKFGESLMVFCKVTAFGKSRTAQLPVMDFRNRAILNQRIKDARH